MDDMLVAGSSIKEIRNMKRQFIKLFEMKELIAAKQIIQMRIVRDMVKRILKVSQTEYVKKVLSRFNISILGK